MINQKGLAPLILIIGTVIVLGLAGGSVYYLKSLNNKEIVISPSLNPSPAASPLENLPSALPSIAQLESSLTSPIPSPSPGSNIWKTYQGNDMTFQYPGNGSIENGGAAVYINSSTKPYFIFSVGISDNPKHLTAKQVAQQTIENIRNNPNAPWLVAQADQMSKTLKDYKNGVIQGVILQSFFEGDPSGYGDIIYTTNDKIYSFAIHNGDGYVNEEQEKILEQIISSLRFTN